MNPRMLIAPAVVALAGAAAYWVLNNLEAEPQRVRVGFSGEARNNPWFAAERLLARMDLRVRQARSIPDLKTVPAGGTLVLPRRLASINKDEQLRLLQWVEGGGHLLIEAESTGQPDPILDALGVVRKSVSTKPPATSKPGAAAERPAKPLASRDAKKKRERYILARLPDVAAPMKVEIGLWRTLEVKEAKLVLREEAATWLVQIERGAGRVTAITELAFARNASLGKHDHAEFLWQLVRLGTSPASRTSVTFFHSPKKLSLWDWLREHAWAALLAGALLVAAWLWRIVPRFGPLAPDPEPARKRLLDHLRASGRFQWSSGGAQALTESARDAALRRILRVHPDFAGLGTREREARLAELFGLTPEAVRIVLQPSQSVTPGGLLAATSVYQAIHDQLSQARGKR